MSNKNVRVNLILTTLTTSTEDLPIQKSLEVVVNSSHAVSSDDESKKEQDENEVEYLKEFQTLKKLNQIFSKSSSQKNLNKIRLDEKAYLTHLEKYHSTLDLKKENEIEEHISSPIKKGKLDDVSGSFLSSDHFEQFRVTRLSGTLISSYIDIILCTKASRFYRKNKITCPAIILEYNRFMTL